MANDLLIRIQREMDIEAEIDRIIDKKKRKFLRENKQFKVVSDREDCDSILYFHRVLPVYLSYCIDDKRQDVLFDENYTFFFLKNKNPHDGRLNSRAFKIKNVDDKPLFIAYRN